MPTEKQPAYVCSMCGGTCTIIEQAWSCAGCGGSGFLTEPEPRPPLNGEQLLTLRTDLGWSRKRLSEESGLTVSKICRIEKGQYAPTQGEAELFEATLMGLLDVTLDEKPKKPVSLVKSGDYVRSASWNGITRGELVKVKNETGTFRFLYHHVDDHQEYVEVFGPVQKRGPQHLRSFVPDRIRAASRKQAS